VTETRDPVTEPRLLLLASIAGLAAIIALPLSVTLPGATLLVFAVPLTLAAVARLQGRPWLINLATLLLVLIGAAMFVDLPLLRLIAAGTLLAGPIIAVVTVGSPLRDADPIAAAAFLLSGTIAVIGGFSAAGASRTGASAIAIGVALTGITVIGMRLRSLA
jgi:hypothetical protein